MPIDNSDSGSPPLFDSGSPQSIGHVAKCLEGRAGVVRIVGLVSHRHQACDMCLSEFTDTWPFCVERFGSEAMFRRVPGQVDLQQDLRPPAFVDGDRLDAIQQFQAVD